MQPRTSHALGGGIGLLGGCVLRSTVPSHTHGAGDPLRPPSALGALFERHRSQNSPANPSRGTPLRLHAPRRRPAAVEGFRTYFQRSMGRRKRDSLPLIAESQQRGFLSSSSGRNPPLRRVRAARDPWTWRRAGDASGWANEGESNQMRSDTPGTGPRNQVPDTHPALRAGHSFSSRKPSDCADWIPGPARRSRDGSSQTLPAPTLYSEEDARYGGFS